MNSEMPMPPDRFAELARLHDRQPRPEALQTVPSREPAKATSDLAAELLSEAAERPLQSGELLLVSEEATLTDLEAVALHEGHGTPTPVAATAAEPLLAALAVPRLLNPRVWEVFGWQPPLAEHMRLLEAALLGGAVVSQVMLVGHVETFPERVEHLMWLRHLVDATAAAGGGCEFSVREVDQDELECLGDRGAGIVRAARPAASDVDRRHALAIARLALGSIIIRTGD